MCSSLLIIPMGGISDPDQTQSTRIWDPKMGGPRRLCAHSPEVDTLSPDLVIRRFGTRMLRLVSAVGKPLKGNTDYLQSVVYSPDG